MAIDYRSPLDPRPQRRLRAATWATIIACSGAIVLSVTPSVAKHGNASRIGGAANNASQDLQDALPMAKLISAPSTHSEAEALLFESILAVRRGALKDAEVIVNRLIERTPNYQLAHLIRADILQARARGLTKIGQGASNTVALQGLVSELEARMSKFSEPAIQGRTPDTFVALSPQVRYALALDTSRARLYVLENTQDGPRHVLDLYATIGASGSGKTKQGDKRTPIGVYTLTESLDKSRLGDFYGEGAYLLDYPNPLDKRAGRAGFGIWIHGVAKENYVRPPKASDGCIVIANADLKLLAPYIIPGKTPIAIAETINWVVPKSTQASALAVRAAMEKWRADWESRDMDRYLDHYASEFFSENVDNLSVWRERRRAFTEQRRSVEVLLNDVSITRVPNLADTVMVTFDQLYKGDALQNSLRKRQYWQRVGERWKIIYEGNA
jgi:murein L,D-transpeptidase YafK